QLSKKCKGASIFVPTCALVGIVLRFATSPRVMSAVCRITTGISPGQCTIPVRSGTEMSIHSLMEEAEPECCETSQAHDRPAALEGSLPLPQAPCAIEFRPRPPHSPAR